MIKNLQSSLRKFEEVGIAKQKNEDPFSPEGIEEAAFSGGKEVVYAANIEEEDAISAIVPSVINESGKGSEGIDNSEQAPGVINELGLASEGLDNLTLVPGEIKVSKLSEGMNEEDLVSEGMDNSTLAPREINEEELVSEGMDNSTLAPGEINEEELVSEGVDNSTLAPREIKENELVAQGTESTTVQAPINVDAVSKKFDEVETDKTSEDNLGLTKVGKDHVFKDISIVGEEVNDSQLTEKGKNGVDEEPIISESDGVVPCDIDRTYKNLESFDFQALTPEEEQKVRTVLIATLFWRETPFFSITVF